MTTFPVRQGTPPAHPGRRRALGLFLAYVVGSALVAAVLAMALGAMWQEVFGWAQPLLTPRSLPG